MVLSAVAREAIVSERTAARFDECRWTPASTDEWIPGMCSVMSEVMNQWFGWEMDGGCYASDAFKEGHHIAHVWNILPDGRIIDTTADQFREGDTPDGIRVVPGDDPRYMGWCEGDSCDPW